MVIAIGHDAVYPPQLLSAGRLLKLKKNLISSRWPFPMGSVKDPQVWSEVRRVLQPPNVLGGVPQLYTF